MEIYTPYDVTTSRAEKTSIAFFVNFGGKEKLFCLPDNSLKFANYESVQYRLQFSGIKKRAKVSFHIGTLKEGPLHISSFLLQISCEKQNKLSKLVRQKCLCFLCAPKLIAKNAHLFVLVRTLWMRETTNQNLIQILQ